jgi:hypothetical protein
MAFLPTSRISATLSQIKQQKVISFSLSRTNKMTDFVTTVWINPPALAIGLCVALASASWRLDLFRKGLITHNHSEHGAFAALVSVVLFVLWLPSTFYVFASHDIFTLGAEVIWYVIISVMFSWPLGTNVATIYTITAWKRQNPPLFDRNFKAA